MMKTQLLCTFTTRQLLKDTILLITECNNIIYNKIYVFENTNNSSQVLCTYNIEYNQDNTLEDVPNTISLHRKKQSNTLYTINALNEVIRSLNNGVLDKKFTIPWDNYKNSLLLVNDNGLNVVPTKIHSIVEVKNK